VSLTVTDSFILTVSAPAANFILTNLKDSLAVRYREVRQKPLRNLLLFNG